MPLITYIPKRYENGFKNIASLKNEAFDAIQEGLSYTSLVSTIRQLTENVAKVKNIDTDATREIFISVGSLIPLLEQGTTAEQIVDEVSSIAVKTDLIIQEHEPIFRKRLSLLLQAQVLYYAAKASDLTTEYENVFLRARVVTDLRPVFGPDVTAIPKAGMTIHNLHIHYRSDIEGAHKDIFLALDSEDVKSLKELLQRAEQKEQVLQNIYKKSDIINLNE